MVNHTKNTADTLIVYNLCGLKRDNYDKWVENIESFLTSKRETPTYEGENHFDFIVSACNVQPATKDKLKVFCKQKNLKLAFIDEVLPVNVTFNLNCLRNPGYDYYVYCASDVNAMGQIHIIQKLKRFHNVNNNAITGAYVIGDTLHVKYSFYKEDLKKGIDVTFRPGEGFNCHFVMFDKCLIEAYGALMPDVFAGPCTESVFYYVTEAIKRRLGMLNAVELSLFHPEASQDLDGSSSGFKEGYGYKQLYKSKLSFADRFLTAEVKQSGFGYEEVYNVLNHDKSLYKNNKCIDPEKLYKIVKKTVYLNKQELDYDKLKYNKVEWLN